MMTAVASSEESLVARVRDLGRRRRKLLEQLEEVQAEIARVADILTGDDVRRPEIQVARDAGISRQTLRIWRGKEDYKGRKIRREA